MSESEEFKEAPVKRITGGRASHTGPQFTFEPGAKLYMTTGHVPIIREGDGSSFWRRLRPIDPEEGTNDHE